MKNGETLAEQALFHGELSIPSRWVLSSISTFPCNVVVSLHSFGASVSGPLQSKPLKMLLAPRVGP